jgi:hypothetical protein
VGWRERDWAKFTDDERAALFGGGRGGVAGPSAESAGHHPRPNYTSLRRRGVSQRRQRISEIVLCSLLGLSALMAAYRYLHSFTSRGSTPVRPGLPRVMPPPQVVQPPSDVIFIRWRSSDLAPAARAGQICVTDAVHGRICASYVIGEAPADTLTRQIEATGLRVESSGSG